MTNDETFIGRWWRRKTAAASSARQPAAANRPPEAPSRGTPPVPLTHPQAGSGGDRLQTHPNSEAEFADVDFDALGTHSDYKRFLAPGVPDAVRTKALARLWRSHPAFAQGDPLQDYAGDFTDKALASPDGVLQTAYRIGRGFIPEEADREPEQGPAAGNSEPGPGGRK